MNATKARLPLVETTTLPEDQRNLAPPESHIFRTFANCPAGLQQYRGMTKFIRSDSNLDSRLREMAMIQIGYAANCPYEYTHHIKSGLASGVTDDDIRAIADETAGRETPLEPLMKAVLRATRQLTIGFDVDDETFRTLCQALGNDGLMALFFSVATYVGTAKLLNSLRVELEDSYKPYLERFPIKPG
ncbi:MAG TPA: carboxymuconolactone decarboxylase family protein [Candidatus Acidoferrales bacterium]|nr:carboxymuconolactone decarboxylase family protein [Candidatus Acidoferrales bacterium]